jgi:hypothetical protein
VEYEFPSWESLFFDMLHYDMNGTKIDSKRVAYLSVRKAIRNLVTRAKQNNAKVQIVKRKTEVGLT